jgi:hypothetical protein
MAGFFFPYLFHIHRPLEVATLSCWSTTCIMRCTPASCTVTSFARYVYASRGPLFSNKLSVSDTWKKQRHLTYGYHLRKPSMPIHGVSSVWVQQKSAWSAMSASREKYCWSSPLVNEDVWIYVPLFCLYPKIYSKLMISLKYVISPPITPISHSALSVSDFLAWLVGEITHFRGIILEKWRGFG